MPAERDVSTGSVPADLQTRRPRRLAEPRTRAGRAALAAMLADPVRALLATDFDGVLAPIVDDPDRAAAHPRAADVLGRLAGRLGGIAVVTGRPVRQVLELGGFEGATGLDELRVLGQYGVERWDARTGTDSPPPPAGIAVARERIATLLADHGLAAVRVEDKGRALGLHLRHTTDPVLAMRCLREPLDALAAELDLRVEPGKHVLELRATGADKGVALESLLAAGALDAHVDVVAYAGDDLGDAAAYDAVERHRTAGGRGLLIWSAAPEPTDETRELAARADLVLDGPEGVVGWLDALADQLDGAGTSEGGR